MDLPPEILGEIFQAYIDAPSPSAPWEEGLVISASTGDSPMILGQICSYWRTLVLGMPTLWSSIFVEYPAPDHIDLVRMWLDRAGSCPLTLVLRDWVDSGNRGCSEGTEAILKMFMEKSNYWKNIDFVLELRESSILDSLEWGACANLESAAICARYCDSQALDTFWAKLHQSPALRRVDWFRTFKSGLPHHAPWAQLRHIKTLSVLSDTDVVFILRTCPELSSLDTHYTSSSEFSLQDPVVHTNLESLILHLAADSTPLFDHISLPSLQILHLNNECGFTPLDISEAVGKPVEGFFHRSQCNLTDLETYNFDDSRNIDQLLRHVLYIPATRCLQRFTLFPIRDDISDLDIIAKHPAECIRDAAFVAAGKEMLCLPCQYPFELVDVECFDEDWDRDDMVFDASFGDDGMTTFQSQLAELHLDD